MSPYRLTLRAVKDLDAIADYTLAKWGEYQAEKYLSEMQQSFERLSLNAGLGRARNDMVRDIEVTAMVRT